MGFLNQIPRRIGGALVNTDDPYSALTPPTFEPSEGSPFELAANRRPPAPPTFSAPRPAPMPPAPAPLDAPPQITPGMPQQAPSFSAPEPRTYTAQMADQREDLIRNRQAPPELRGFRKYASAFIRGGPMGVAQTAIMGNYPEQQAKQQFREQQAEDLYNLSRERDKDQSQQLYKEAQTEALNAAKDQRLAAAAARNAPPGAEAVGSFGYYDREGVFHPAPPKFERVSPGEALIDPSNPQKPVYSAAPKPESPRSVSRGGTLVGPDGKVIYQDPRQPASSAGASAASGGDAEAIADAIIAGQQPPDLKYLYRMGGPVRASLARKQYDMTTAQRDWQAIQRHIATLNGPQQERLRQAVAFTYDSLDNIEQQYTDLQKTGLPTGFPMWNKAALKVAVNVPGQTGATARALIAQINDLTSELGTVYKGGNASTDESLRLAAENLKADWNPEQFKQAMAMIRKNLQIRKNSIMNSQPVGVSPNSPYNTGTGTPAPESPAAGGTVKLQAPDGTVKDVPADKADYFIQRGAKRVGGK